MQAVLVMFRNDGERRSFSISREMTVIGRRQDCDLMIPLGEISRKHCRIIRDADTLRIEDLGSSNGTFHNGRRIQETVLEPGDTIQVGPVTFVLQIDGVPGDDEIQPFATGTAPASLDDSEMGNKLSDSDLGEIGGDIGAESHIGLEDDGAPTAGHEDELEVIPDDTGELEEITGDLEEEQPKKRK